MSGNVERNDWGRTEIQEKRKAKRRNKVRFSTEVLAVYLETEYNVEWSSVDYYRGAIKRKALDFRAEHLPCARCKNAGKPARKGDAMRSRTNHWDHLVPVGGAFRGAIEDLPEKHVRNKDNKITLIGWNEPEMVTLLCYRCNSEKGRRFDDPLNRTIQAMVRHKLPIAARRKEIMRHTKLVQKWLDEAPINPIGA